MAVVLRAIIQKSSVLLAFAGNRYDMINIYNLTEHGVFVQIICLIKIPLRIFYTASVVPRDCFIFLVPAIRVTGCFESLT